ncbi:MULTISPECIES: RNA polymerase sigma factor [Sutcliffiella]|uniref:RNA polymerase sigma factor n=1 Tax=Sutcliffiella cohnii TaxID=33932 RepID=A0A223KWM9_9BACI|nr:MULTISPECIES: RNA polymerase sigma factor [Sutcliffiella]AST93852.1 hypothetical protein BC6307_22530 [Sutcliffiella cohnii]MED4015818.1 RNA polymerase sigma factor [Sutcliffiella cohnii]WBL15044.1 RNA polymerase sigma factor [Sutcliffiella sp. NC1]
MLSDKEKKDKVEEWYSQHSDDIFKYIGLMLNDYHKAEDLTQETFVKSFIYFEQFQYNSSVKTWLFMIARNTTIDYLRKNKKYKIIAALLSKNLESDVINTAEEIIELKEDVSYLYTSIKNLKPAYREVIILRKIKGFSTKETSEILGWTESKVKSTLFRSIKKLEQELNKGGYVYEQKFS